MKTKVFLFFFLFISLLSCTNKTDVRFLGKSLKTPCNSFVNHIIKKGFTYRDGNTYNGTLLGKDVSITLMDSVDGHYKELMLIASFIDSGSEPKQFYISLCNKIKNDHSGFEVSKSEDGNSYRTEFYGENGSMITVICSSASYGYESFGSVVAFFKNELVSVQ